MAAGTKAHTTTTEAPAAEQAGANGATGPLQLLREAIMAVPQAPPTPATLAGFPVWIRGLTGTERSEWDQEQFRRTKGGVDPYGGAVNIRGRLLVRTIVDQDGMRVFSDTDAATLGAREAAELEPLFDEALRRSGLSAAEQEVIADDLKAPSAGSGTG